MLLACAQNMNLDKKGAAGVQWGEAGNVLQTLNSHISLVRGTVALGTSCDVSGWGEIVLATMMGNGCACEAKDELGWHR